MIRHARYGMERSTNVQQRSFVAQIIKMSSTPSVGLVPAGSRCPFVAGDMILPDGPCATAAGDADNAVTRLKEAVAIEDSIDDLSQPPYPIIPATELFGTLLLDLNRPAEAVPYFRKTVQRTPNRPKVIFGLARAAQALGDNATARERYQEFLSIWKDADPDLPEVATAKEFLAQKLVAEK